MVTISTAVAFKVFASKQKMSKNMEKINDDRTILLDSIIQGVYNQHGARRLFISLYLTRARKIIVK